MRILATLFLCPTLMLSGQTIKLERYSIPEVTVQGSKIPNPWAGGFNAPIIQEIDLNRDSIPDLLVFERSDFDGQSEAGRVYPFLNNGKVDTPSYTFAPEYIRQFPEFYSWIIIRDFNCDGIEDIFDLNKPGMRYRKGQIDTAGKWSFQLVESQIGYVGGSVISVSLLTLPEIVDIDHDGDLDILAFDASGHMNFYKNGSLEAGAGCDSVLFTRESACWGKFCDCSAANSTITLNDTTCTGLSCFYQPQPESGGFRHGGSGVITAADLNCDGNYELFIGDELSSHVAMLTNGSGPCDSMIAVDQTFPSNDVPANIDVFVSVYIHDVNNDGLDDLLISHIGHWGSGILPNEDTAQNVDNVWYYENTGTDCSPQFTLRTKSFFSEQMIDAGENSNPAFFDYDGDGLLDIVVGRDFRMDTSRGFVTGLELYRNTGTAQFPAFEHVDYDYHGLASLGLRDLAPTFGDLDGDGDEDMLFGSDRRRLRYYENTAGAGNPATFVLVDTFYQGITTGFYPKPDLFDRDNDGDLDLFIGDINGRLILYDNIGNATTPNFNKLSVQAGFVNESKNSSFQAVMWHDSVPRLIAGGHLGSLSLYRDIDTDWKAFWPKESSSLTGIYENGTRASLAAADINGDTAIDVLVGNTRGGLTLWSFGKPKKPSSIANIRKRQFNIFPNPTPGVLHITTNFREPIMSYEVVNVLGQPVHSALWPGLSTISLEHLPVGLYILRLNGEGFTAAKQFILSR